MKNLFFALMFLLSLNTFAEGQGSGNGGGAYVCYFSDGYIRYAELEDFVEWNIYENINFEHGSTIAHDQIINSLVAFDPLLGAYVKLNFESIKKEFMDGLKRIRFEPAESSNGIFSQARIYTDRVHHCDGQFETAAKYTDRKLLVSKDIYDFMYSLDKQGLLYHEVIFKALRELYGQTDSSETRKIVAAIFGNRLDLLDEIGTNFKTDRKRYRNFNLSKNFMNMFYRAGTLVTSMGELKDKISSNGIECTLSIHGNTLLATTEGMVQSGEESLKIDLGYWSTVESTGVVQFGNMFALSEDRLDPSNNQKYNVKLICQIQ